MKNEKGFTLIELIAVVVILAVIMLIAVPNVVTTINKNKKETFIEDAKKFKAAVEAKITTDTSIEYPNTESVLVFKLKQVGKNELDESPYGTKYAEDASWVAVAKESKTVTSTESNGVQTKTYNQLVYYVHLVTCSTSDCNDEDVDARYGINFDPLDNIGTSDRYNMVVQAEDVDMVGDIPTYVKAKLGNKVVKMYTKK